VKRKGLLLGVAATAVFAAAPPAQAYIYWTVEGVGLGGGGTTIGRADQDGSSVNHALISSASQPGGVVVDGSHIYWANGSTNSIGRANLDGSGANPSFIANATCCGGLATEVAVDGSYIYWTDGERYIGRAHLDGTGASATYIDDGNNYPYGIAVSDGTIYFSDGGVRIRDVQPPSTTPQTLVTLPASATPTSMVIAGGYIYYAALNLGNPNPSGTIGRVAVSGGSPDENFVPGINDPTGVAVDGQEVYWVDHQQNVIGRAQLTGSGITNADYSWISEPGGPLGVAVDDNVDATKTTVSCSPSSVAPGSATACTAIVADSASSSPPTGTVAFSSDATTFFSGSGSSCTLAQQQGGTYACTVGVDSTSAGTIPITATYQGDSLHQSSSGHTTFCAGSATQCGGTSGGGAGGTGASGGRGGSGSSSGSAGGATHRCVVPKLRGRTLAQARTLLARADCRLGKVSKPRKSRHRKLVIASQRPAPGSKLPAGTAVAVKLGAR
jgi:hypothetical protein